LYKWYTISCFVFVWVFCLSLCTCLPYNWLFGWWESMQIGRQLNWTGMNVCMHKGRAVTSSPCTATFN
jgi:hypothetical protein